MAKVKATHYICVKDKEGKDLLILRRGDEKSLSKKEIELLEKEASGKFVNIEETTNAKD